MNKKDRRIINVTFIISDIGKALAFEWIAAHIDKTRFNLNFILLNSGDSDLENFLKKHNFTVNRITYKQKKDIPKSILKVYRLLKKHKTDVIHAHLITANLVGLPAAWMARIPKRIHTRHHSDFHHVWFPKAVKYDKIVNRLSTHIVAISDVVKKILIDIENVPEKKIHLIYHGFDLNNFINVPKENVDSLRKKYIPLNGGPVIGVISRQIEWKGIQYVIPAFQRLLKTHPDALLILANACGDYKKEIQKLLAGIPKENYIEIIFENDIFSLYQLFDVFVHVPVGGNVEAFGQTYVEALAAGIPSVFTESGIAKEFIKHERNSLIVPFKDSDSIYNAINRILEDKNLRTTLRENGRQDVQQKFALHNMIDQLEKLYER